MRINNAQCAWTINNGAWTITCLRTLPLGLGVQDESTEFTLLVAFMCLLRISSALVKHGVFLLTISIDNFDAAIYWRLGLSCCMTLSWRSVFIDVFPVQGSFFVCCIFGRHLKLLSRLNELSITYKMIVYKYIDILMSLRSLACRYDNLRSVGWKWNRRNNSRICEHRRK